MFIFKFLYAAFIYVLNDGLPMTYLVLSLVFFTGGHLVLSIIYMTLTFISFKVTRSNLWVRC